MTKERVDSERDEQIKMKMVASNASIANKEIITSEEISRREDEKERKRIEKEKKRIGPEIIPNGTQGIPIIEKYEWKLPKSKTARMFHKEVAQSGTVAIEMARGENDCLYLIQRNKLKTFIHTLYRFTPLRLNYTLAELLWWDQLKLTGRSRMSKDGKQEAKSPERLWDMLQMLEMVWYEGPFYHTEEGIKREDARDKERSRIDYISKAIEWAIDNKISAQEIGLTNYEIPPID